MIIALASLLCSGVSAQSFSVPTPAPQCTVYAHPWMQKRVAYLGDSITDPKNKAASKKYWYYLQQWLGITPWVYGISGRQWNDIPRQVEQLHQEHGDSVDAIVVFIGTNDFNDGVPIGEWYELKDEEVMAGIHEPKHMVSRRRMVPLMTSDTYRGRINKGLKALKQTYPTKQIVLLTPIHRAGFYRSDTNWQPTEDYYNRAGEPFLRYVEAIKEAGNLWSVPVIDLNALSGLFPMMDEHVRYFHDKDADRLHPNDKGHERLARTLYYQLGALPGAF